MKSLYILIMSLLPVELFGQTVTLQTDKNLIAYYNIINPITIGVENCSCDSVFIRAKKYPVIKSESNNCQYSFKPEGFGFDTIFFFRLLDNNDTLLIGQKRINIKELPMIGTYGGKIDKDGISKKSFQNFPNGFSVIAYNTGLELRIPIDSFYLIVKRDCRISYNRFCKITDNFDDAKKEFLSLKSGDEIIFKMMFYSFPSGEINMDREMRLTIID